jgi:branched-chain amino acid transport system substrate-binding protein
MKKIWITVGIVLIAALAIILIVTQTRKESEVIKIGVILPLTGNGANYGEKTKIGLDIALYEINSKIKDKKILLVYEDSYGTPQNAVNALNKLINIDKVQIVIGPIFSDEVLACAPIANSKKVILFITAAASDNIKAAGEYVFRNRLSASSLSYVLANYVLKKLSLKNIVVLFENSANAIDYKNGFVNTIKAANINVLLEESFDKGSTDFRTQIQKAKDSKPEAVFITGHAEEIGYFIRQSKEMGLKVQFISTAGAEGSELLKIAENAAEGLIYATDAFTSREGDPETESFIKKYKEKMKVEPDFFSVNAYDALQVIAHVGQQNGWRSSEVKKGLLELKDYQSVGGIYSFDKDGEIYGKPVAIKIIRDGKFTLLTIISE